MVGRDPNADFPIGDDSVSRHHAELTLTPDGRLFVTDCRSRNGTYVLHGSVSEPLQQGAVSLDSSLKFGEVVLLARDLADRMGANRGQTSGEYVRCRACMTPVLLGQRCGECGRTGGQ